MWTCFERARLLPRLARLLNGRGLTVVVVVNVVVIEQQRVSGRHLTRIENPPK
jgi:hypothetical protein